MVRTKIQVQNLVVDTGGAVSSGRDGLFSGSWRWQQQQWQSSRTPQAAEAGGRALAGAEPSTPAVETVVGLWDNGGDHVTNNRWAVNLVHAKPPAVHGVRVWVGGV